MLFPKARRQDHQRPGEPGHVTDRPAAEVKLFRRLVLFDLLQRVRQFFLGAGQLGVVDFDDSGLRFGWFDLGSPCFRKD